jgi:hypothetical protein
MTKPFDASFFIGVLFVVASIGVAALALNGRALPIIGGGRGPLIAVTIIGMSGCAIAGISQSTALGWTHPLILIGSALGLVALAVILAGLFGWDSVVRPIAAVAPGASLATATTEDLALIAIAALIALKFAINLGFAVVRAAS